MHENHDVWSVFQALRLNSKLQLVLGQLGKRDLENWQCDGEALVVINRSIIWGYSEWCIISHI